ncbi:MAG: HEPN domain-containing protein [Sulfolobales archaeon]
MICARELDRHYIPSRYPNAHPAGTPHEAYDHETSRRAIECARRIIDYARGLIRK